MIVLGGVEMTINNGSKKDKNSGIALSEFYSNEKDIFGIQEFKNILTESLNPLNAFTEAFAINPSIYRGAAVQSEVLNNINLITDGLRDFSYTTLIARNMVGETALGLKDSINSLLNFKEMTSAVSEVLKVIPESNMTALQATVDNFKGAASFFVADRLLVAMSDFDFKLPEVTDISTGVEFETSYEMPKEKAHNLLVKDAEISKEETGKEVPYNVLSDNFIYNYYIPAMGVIYNAYTSETIDVNFIIGTLIFTIVPMIYSLSQDRGRNDNNKKSKVVNFNDDITFID